MGYRREDSGEPGELSAECQGYELRDREGEKIGKVDEVFVDDSDRPQYLGVKTGLLGGKLNLVPADLASADGDNRRIELSASRDQIKDAPSLDSNEEITSDREREVREHFGLGSGPSSEENDRESSAPGYREDSSDNDYPESSQSGERKSRHNEDGTSEAGEPWSDRVEDTRSRASEEEHAGDTSHGAGSAETEERRRDDDTSQSGDRETVRVSVRREKAKAERVTSEDGGEEVRIRKEWVEEEEIVEVEDRR